MAFHTLRRVLAASGLQVATTRPAGAQGRREESRTRPARLVEHPTLETRAVGPAETCPHDLGFLDGVQRHQVVAYAGTHPLVAATVAAAVRVRREGGRELSTALRQSRSLLLGHRDALDAVALPEGHEAVVLSDDEPDHPIRELELAVAAIDDARSGLEVRVGEAFRQRHDHWLVVDGSLAESPAFAADPRMIGVSKSHATLPFGPPELDTYLRLAPGHRTSVFQPASRRIAPVHAWGLRLWPWEGRDLLFGLVRVEVAPDHDSHGRADLISRWLLAERAPVPARDARWDRLLYGIHSVEEYLRASFTTA